MNKVSSREYKVMMDHRLFDSRKATARSFWRELSSCAERLQGANCEGDFESTDKREIVFLDTVDETIRLTGLLFRQRRELEKARTEYTLKCRSPDHLIAAAAKVDAGSGLEQEQKFEEDIGAPFIARFSRSAKVNGPDDAPSTLGDAGRLFPSLLKLKRDGVVCPDSLALVPANGLAAFERVLKGLIVHLRQVAAQVAIILWSHGAEGRPWEPNSHSATTCPRMPRRPKQRGSQ